MKSTDIAIIGIAGRFPNAKDTTQFWENLVRGDEGIRFFTKEELRDQGVIDQTLDHPHYVRANGLIDEIGSFDAQYFGFTPREASILSPQHRLALECAQQALENAGYRTSDFEDRIGVYMGAGLNSYLLNHILPNREEVNASIGYYKTMAYNLPDTLPSFIAYKLNLKGPAVNINTACSTSLVSVHYACQALLTYECDMALAGGVSIPFTQKSGYWYEPGGILSPDGYCRAFDADSAGTVPGGGAGVVVVKRLSEALADHDNILAVIEGSAINNDGSDKVGFTAPSTQGQAEVILDAQLMADIQPEDIQYIETHGTGTKIGDPIEITALTSVFQQRTDSKKFCAIGSVKPNIGHLDAAAGVASLIKTTLAVHHGKVPPSLHYKKANAHIDFENSPFYVNHTLNEWPDNGQPKRAGVSSFGIGGTNAHAIIREAPAVEQQGASREDQVITLSAKSLPALQKMKGDLTRWLQTNESIPLEDIAYTLHVGREHHQYRWASCCTDIKELLKKLSQEMAFHDSTKKSNIVFYFSGSIVHQWRRLFEEEPSFRNHINHYVGLAQKITGTNYSDAIMNGQGAEDENACARSLERFTAFITQLALVKLWEEWGVKPSKVMYHGYGLYSAACIANALSFEDGLADILEINRSDLVATTPEQQIRPVLPIINVNNKQELPVETLADAASRESQTTISPNHPAKEGTTNLPGDMVIHISSGQRDLPKGAEQPNIKPAVEVRSNRALYETLGDLWALGTAIDWKSFYAHEQRSRVPLPTYPFERKWHWIDAKKQVFSPEKPMQAHPLNEDRKVHFFQPSWEEFFPSAASDKDRQGSWLLFIDENPLVKKLTSKVKQESHKCCIVRKGKRFKKLKYDEYVIDPDSPNDYRLLVDALMRDEAIPETIVHAWNVTSVDLGDGLSDDHQLLTLGYYSLIYLFQAFGPHTITPGLKLNILCSQIHSIYKEEEVIPFKTTLLGPCRVIPQEFPGVSCRTIDVSPKGIPSAEQEVAVNDLFANFLNDLPLDNAYRGGKWFKRGFTRADALKRKSNAGKGIRKSGVYLITGGLGGLGLNLAEHLANGQNTVILLSRRALPPKKNWKSLISQNDDQAQKLKRIQQIEEGGATVVVYKADVSDRRRMKAVIEGVIKKYGEINGVIHAAGVVGMASMITLKELDQDNKRHDGNLREVAIETQKIVEQID